MLALSLSLLTPQSVATELAQFTDPFFTHRDITALPSSIRVITQDSYGFIWFGTDKGVLRYDGFNYKRFSYNPEDPTTLLGNKVRIMSSDKLGKVWIVTDLGLSVFDPVTESFETFVHDENNEDSLSHNWINAFAFDKDGVWMSVLNGLDFFSYKTRKFSHYPGGIDYKANFILELALDKKGNLWLATRAGLKKFVKKTKKFIDVPLTPAFEPNTKIVTRTVKIDEQDTLWIGTYNKGLLWLANASEQNNEQFEVKHVSGPPLFDAYIKQKRAYAITEVGNEVWFATQVGDGILVVNKQSKKIVKRISHKQGIKNSLKAGYINRMLKDHSGLIWVVHENGELSLYNSKNSAFSMVLSSPVAKDKLNLERVGTVIETHEQQVVVAFDKLFLLDPVNETKVKELFPSSIANEYTRFYQSARAPNGDIWFIGNSYGKTTIFKMTANFKSLERLYSTETVSCRVHRYIAIDSKGVLWTLCGPEPKLIGFDVNNNSVVSYPLAAKESGRFHYKSLEIDKMGTIWISSDRGLFYMSQQSPKNGNNLGPQFVKSLGSSVIYDTLITKSEHLWVDSDLGLYRHDLKKSQQLENNLPHKSNISEFYFEQMNEQYNLSVDESLGNMVEDDAGRIWGNKGMLDTKNMTYTRFYPNDGFRLGNINYSAAIKKANGNILFGGENGLLIIEPTKYQPRNFVAPLAILNLKIDGSFYPGVNFENITLNKNENSFSVEFARLDYYAPHSDKFSYKLVGYDDEWRKTDAAHRRISYSKLKPGSYSLEIKSTHAPSLAPLKIAVTVLPKWYQTKIFYFFLIAASLFLLYLAYYFRVLQLRQKAQRLTKLVDVRTQELKEKNILANQTLDELRTTQAELIESEKHAALGRMVRGVAHELNTPLGTAKLSLDYTKETFAAFTNKFSNNKITKNDVNLILQNADESFNLLESNINRCINLVSVFKKVAADQGSNAKKEKFNVAKAITRCTRLLATEFQNKQINIVTLCDQNLFYESFEEVFNSLITLLIDNTIQHAFPEGLQSQSKRTVQIYAEIVTKQNNKDVLRILVEDNGVGISSKNSKELFDPFFTTARGQGSVGLGLHIAYNITHQQLGGSISYKEKRQAGACIEILLPIDKS